MKMTEFEAVINEIGESSSAIRGSSNSHNHVAKTTSCNVRPPSRELKTSKIPSPKPSEVLGQNNRLGKSTAHKKGRVSTPSNVKPIRFYRNGDSHQEEQLVSLDLTSFNDWSECLEEINRTVNYPGTIQLLFTVKGKKVSCLAELEKQTDIVVSGKSPFRLLPYGPSMSPPNQTKSPQWRPNSARRPNRATFTKSVIIEPYPDDIMEDSGAALIKTFSEHNVSSNSVTKPSPLVDSEILRASRGASPRGRPVSCYNTPFTLNNCGPSPLSSTDEKNRKCTPVGNCTSRIPKRILPNSNILNGGAAVMSSSTPLGNTQTPSPARAMQRSLVSSSKAVRGTSKERPSKPVDVTKKEFIRPRRVKIIVKGTKPRKASRFLLNKKTAVAFDQVLSAITESIKPEWGAVRKVYTLDGHEVATLEGFFGEGDTFLLCPNDRVTPEDLDLDAEECKVLKIPYESEPAKRSKIILKSTQQRRPPSEHLVSGQPSARSQIPSYPTHPKFLPVARYPNEVKEKYIIGEIIGDGNFAVVRLVTDKKSNTNYALKVIDKSTCNHDAPPDHEVAILSKVVHPNIILVYDKIDHIKELYVIMELIPSGDLFDHIADVTKFSETESARMTRDIASALSFLHGRRIVHRDIKPENLLVAIENGIRRIKLGDFGLAQEIKGPLFTVCGTPTYVSPEILAETGYGRPVDIWAAGVILYILLCGYPPFVSPTGEQEDLFDLILTGDFEFLPDHWDTISDDAKSLIMQMLEVDPDLRLDAETVLEHPWLASNAEDCAEKRNRLNRKGDFQFSVFESMGLSKLQFPSSMYSNSNTKSNPPVIDLTEDSD